MIFLDLKISVNNRLLKSKEGIILVGKVVASVKEKINNNLKRKMIHLEVISSY